MSSDTIIKKDGSDTIDKQFTKAFNDIADVYNAADDDDELSLNKCIADARALLAEPAIPRYHRIKTLLILASMVGDYDEAFQFHYDADIQLRVVRAHETKSVTSPKTDAALDELQVSVDGLRRVLAEEDAAPATERAIAKQEKKAAEEAERIVTKKREKKAVAAKVKKEKELELAGARHPKDEALMEEVTALPLRRQDE